VGGKGGGKPDMAMAGGTDAAALPKALAGVAAWVGERA
jgi:alanyl-tRNA synthetase